MAEFVEVMRAAQRMCSERNTCEGCPAEGRQCVFIHNVVRDWVMAEQIAMDWAKAHPEPVYPSWYDWQKENFPDNTRYICPMAFGVPCPAPSVPGVEVCKRCRDKPIPAEIAARLGIQAKRA